MDIQKILNGAYDLHMHTAPDVVERKLDDIDMAERSESLGIKGFGIKSHYFCTSERARLVKKMHPKVNPLGAIVLNNTVGGFNPTSVEVAARDGAKIVWMPTFDSANEQNFLKSGKYKVLPFWAKMQEELEEQGKTQESLSALDSNNNLNKDLLNVLDIISDHNLILATGHLGKKETFAVVEQAKDMNIKKIIVTHPNFPSTYYTKEEQKKLADMGAYMEHCFTTAQTGKVSWETMYDQIKYVGANHCILSTDLGQPKAMYPDEGLKLFYENLGNNGFTEEEIIQMAQTNTSYLVEE